MERCLYANARIGNHDDKLAPAVMVCHLHRCEGADGRLSMLYCIGGKLSKVPACSGGEVRSRGTRTKERIIDGVFLYLCLRLRPEAAHGQYSRFTG